MVEDSVDASLVGAAPSRRWLLLERGLIAAYAVLACLVQVALGMPLGVVAALLLAGAMAVRRDRVELMVVLAAAAGLVQVLTLQVAVVPDLAYALVCFELGSRPEEHWRRRGLLASVGAVAAAGLVGLVSTLDSDTLATSALLGAATATAAAVIAVGGWVTGLLGWSRRQALGARVRADLAAVEQRRLRETIDQEQERAAIATDMHDLVAHSWAVVAAQADGARYALPGDPPAAIAALEVIGDTARQSMADLDSILARLRRQEVPDLTPGSEHQQVLLARMRASGMDLVVHRRGIPDDSPLITLTAHRVLGEALTNVLKHGDLSRPVEVIETWGEGGSAYALEVRNTRGHHQGTPGTGRGLVGMRERAAVVDGTLSAVHEGDLWLVRLRVPAPDLGAES